MGKKIWGHQYHMSDFAIFPRKNGRKRDKNEFFKKSANEEETISDNQSFASPFSEPWPLTQYLLYCSAFSATFAPTPPVLLCAKELRVATQQRRQQGASYPELSVAVGERGHHSARTKDGTFGGIKSLPSQVVFHTTRPHLGHRHLALPSPEANQGRAFSDFGPRLKLDVGFPRLNILFSSDSS